MLADAVAAVLGLVVQRRRPLQLEERDVGGARQRDALRGDAGGADDQLRAVGLLERADRRPRAPRSCRAPKRCSASGKRSSTASWTSRWRAKTTSGSPEARKSWIQASAALSLPRAARRCSAPSCASRSARSVAAIFALRSRELQRLGAQPLDHVALGDAVLALVVQRRRARRRGAWPAAAAAPRSSAAARSSARRRCQCSRSSVSTPWNWREKRAPLPNSSSRPMIAQLRRSAPRRG